MDKIWQTLYNNAAAASNPRDISDTIFSGSVSAAVLTASGNIYTGVSVDAACSIGFCAERNAIGSMLTAGEYEITKLVAVKNGAVILPCGVCREFLMQLSEKSADMEILTELEPLEHMKLADLLPHYWK
ncbi:MAG: cytidine deaminase [Streptococcaceae bacterium]|jgi:cytidine deaminase|nr:cytidine deaminase [Streptococcaceae bacterium]